LTAEKKTDIPDDSFTHVALNAAMHVIPDGDAVLEGR